MKKICAIGGGTGLSRIFRILRDEFHIRGVITVADDGLSTGRLRREFNIPAMGDLRNCMVSLARAEKLADIYNYRFEKPGHYLDGHNLGNIIMTALTDMCDSFEEAVQISADLLDIQGEIYPSTLANVKMVATYWDGRVVQGQYDISHGSHGVVNLKLECDEDIIAYQPAIDTIENADMILLGPGSLYTSIIVNLLVPGIKEAVRDSPAIKAYVCSSLDKDKESEGYSASELYSEVMKYAGFKVDNIIVTPATNSQIFVNNAWFNSRDITVHAADTGTREKSQDFISILEEL